MGRLVFAVLLYIGTFFACDGERTFGIDFANNTFVKDGKPFRYISGSIHYTRVPYQYWDDRLHKMAAAGLNAIQTYVPWNAHEAVQGVYNFKEQQNIVQFLETAQKYNLAVILRPGPYICAEWEFGGLPAWLLKYPNMKVRTSDPNYVKNVKKWLTRLYDEIALMLYKNGGPIITIQIENEYGSYPACDYEYLTTLKNLTQSLLGDDVVLFSTDGDGDGYLKCGTIPGVYSTVDFGITYDPEKNFEIQRHKEPNGPLVNSEYYTGWLDHWGQNHSTVPSAAVSASLDLQLALGANVNMYMFEGGTNFGFWNGANYPYHPVPTSYDYDAPLTEAGDITNKYMMIRNITMKYNGEPKIKIPSSTPKAAYGQLKMTYVGNVVQYVMATSTGTRSVYPLTMEDIDHYYGYILYEHKLPVTISSAELNLSGVRDRAHVMVGTPYNQRSFGVVDRTDMNQTVTIDGAAGDFLYILVENMGRINYGGQMNDNLKGLITNVTIDGNILTHWQQYQVHTEGGSLQKYTLSRPLLNAWEGQDSSKPLIDPDIPALYKGEFTLADEPNDTYLDMMMWTKGIVYVNAMNIGRYWPHKGPQVRLYVPKYALQKGSNAVGIIETEKSPCDEEKLCYVTFYDTPLINATVPSVADKGDIYTERMYYKGVSNPKSINDLDRSKVEGHNYGKGDGDNDCQGQGRKSIFQILYKVFMILVDSKLGYLLL